MRLLLTIILFILVEQSHGQESEVKLKLADDVTLIFIKETFDPKGKKIEMHDNVVISIDNGLVFGTDGEMPRTYLKRASLSIGSQEFALQVDGMYNPWHKEFFNDKLFRLKKVGTKYIITGGFSDGAGFYGVEWVAFGRGCTRTILTDDERMLFEYMDL